MPITNPVNDDVVNDATVFCTKKRVLSLTVLKPGNITGCDPLQVLESVGPGHINLAHVADVKEANGVANGMVLGEHARRVLDWHLPATEWNHSATQGNMRIKERRASERFAPWVLRHGSLSFEALTASCHMIRR